MTIHYRSLPQATPLSLSLPRERVEHSNKATRAWFEGLLPSSSTARLRLAEKAGVSARNTFALLAEVGLDCPGAVQLISPEKESHIHATQGWYEETNKAEIAERIRRLRHDEASWTIPDESWSLGGAQARFTLFGSPGGVWKWAKGAAPSTHNVKLSTNGVRLSALNEHICLSAIKRVGIPAVATSFIDFAGEPALVVERYDRRELPGGIGRLHGEDMCQALGVTAAYAHDGGPSAVSIVDLLSQKASARSRDRFILQLMCTYLLGAPDGYARNYSLLLAGTDIALAPAYDVVSSLPYDVAGGGILHSRKIAMGIDGECRFGNITWRRWEKFFTRTGVSLQWGFSALDDLARALPDAVASVLTEVETGWASAQARELRSRFLDAVAHSCQRALDVSVPS